MAADPVLPGDAPHGLALGDEVLDEGDPLVRQQLGVGGHGLAATEMMCPAPLMAQEQALLDALSGARRYVRERTELTLIGSDGRSASFQQTDWD
jgi:hypothetical protein